MKETRSEDYKALADKILALRPFHAARARVRVTGEDAGEALSEVIEESFVCVTGNPSTEFDREQIAPYLKGANIILRLEEAAVRAVLS
jgi:hypothetical protein